MWKRPNELIILTLAMIAIALSVMVQSLLLDSSLASRAWAAHTFLILCAVFHGFIVYRGSRFLLFTGVLFTLAFVWTGWVISRNFYIPLFISAMIHSVLTTPKMRKILRDQNFRWWRSLPRKVIQVRALIRPVEGGEFKSVTYDLSLGGAFFPFGEADWRSPMAPKLKYLRVGSRCTVQLVFNQLKMVSCSAEIVRNTLQRGSYPSGFAVKFLGLDVSEKKILSEFIDCKKA